MSTNQLASNEATTTTPAPASAAGHAAHTGPATTTPTGPANTSAKDAPAAHPWRKVAGLVVGIAIAVSLMVLAFLAPMINSGPKDLPIAVSGPAPIVEKLQTALDTKQPDAFTFEQKDTAEAAKDAVHDRTAVGAIAVSSKGEVEITVAGGAGTPYSPLMKGIGDALKAQGMQVTVNDVAPLTTDDPNGSGLAALGLPLAFGGMISAVLLSTVLKHRRWHRVIGSLLASTAVGFAVIAILQFGFGSLDGNYVTTALALALGTAAISLFVLGMESLFGFPGLGIGGLTMMFVANPLAGMATGWQWLPAPWGAIGQFLPIGASGTLIRSVAFFDGQGAGEAIAVLSGWVALGLVLIGLGAMRKRAQGQKALLDAAVAAQA